MAAKNIIIRGAREHNLKDINLDLPRDHLIVITGLSGSGKSSLAFDTIYADGQRRYVESLSAYARQFLGQMDKPDVDLIEGLSPAISIEQRTVSRNPRSTVGTITEIYDYLRLLFARCGIPHCHICGKEIQSQSIDQMIEDILTMEEGTKIQILSPIVRGRKGEYKKEIADISKKGFVRIRIDGEVFNLSDNLKDIKLDKYKKHDIEIIVDRIVIKEGIRERLADSMETSLSLSEGMTKILYQSKGETEWKERFYSERFACVDCGISLEEIHPRLFSFNAPHGACPECHGLGEKTEFDMEKVVPNDSLSIYEGAIAPIGNLPNSTWYRLMFESLAKKYKFSLETPFRKLSQKVKDIILYGSGNEEIPFYYESKNKKSVYQGKSRYEGMIPMLSRRFRETNSESAKTFYIQFMSTSDCQECKGKRLRPEALAITIKNYNIADITELSIKAALQFFKTLHFDDQRAKISERILKEILNRLNFLNNVGLEYITLNRKAGTLSGGEAQRIRLATQIGSQLVGVLYVLDEPTIGLHQRDNDRLINTLLHLRDIGNTLIVVEHDERTIMAADYIVDLGPGAGVHGGYVVATGSPENIVNHPDSLTGKYLRGEQSVSVPKKTRKGNGHSIVITKARKNNLKGIDIEIPLGRFICVTGVSGSGKSTMVNEIMFPAIAEKVSRMTIKGSGFKTIKGYDHIDKIINIDQSPIGRTPRSNPATYTGVFTPIRELFASLKESKMRGYSPGRFSFNVRGGRCETCEGDGTIKIEMHFLPDIYVICDVCKGKRYNRETLEVHYKGKSISDVLEMTIEEALDFFENQPKIVNKLKTIFEVGLGYIKLGQSATTLSGGEAQRVKLATELSKRSTGKTFYLLDEPTTGLHFDDVKKLIEVLHRLVDQGNTVLVIEHNLDVIKTADHIIDLGPEGGDEGGRIIASGPPKYVAENPNSYTGKYLQEMLVKNDKRIKA